MTQPTINDYKMSRAEAFEQGFKIDSTCYPNVAYKGNRFRPTELVPVPTEREEPYYLMATAFARAALQVTRSILALREAFGKLDLEAILEGEIDDDDEST